MYRVIIDPQAIENCRKGIQNCYFCPDITCHDNELKKQIDNSIAANKELEERLETEASEETSQR